MKIEVNIEKRYAFGVIGAFLILAGVLGVFAYNYANPVPANGHNGDQILVNTKGGEMTLQQAIDNNEFAGSQSTSSDSGLGSSDCYWIKSGRWGTPTCKDGFYVKGIYNGVDGDWNWVNTYCCKG